MEPSKLFKNSTDLIPAIIQEENGVVLMMAYMNEEAYAKTKAAGYVWFWSRSRKRLWMKGEESGNKLKVLDIKEDCDADTLLITVKLEGKCACHTGTYSCFGDKPSFSLAELYSIIKSRIDEKSENSYIASLTKDGVNPVLAKIEEEADEVIDAVRNKEKKDIVWEVADLLFHTLVLMAQQKITIKDIERELEGRNKKKSDSTYA